MNRYFDTLIGIDRGSYNGNTLLCADNQETMGKMLQEFNLLYPVREETLVCIPEPGEGERLYSRRADSR